MFKPKEKTQTDPATLTIPLSNYITTTTFSMKAEKLKQHVNGQC